MKLKVVLFLSMFSACIFLLTGPANAQYTEKWAQYFEVEGRYYSYGNDSVSRISDFNGDSYPEIIVRCYTNDGNFNYGEFNYIIDGTSGHILWSTLPDWSIGSFGNTDDDPYLEVIIYHYNSDSSNYDPFKILDGRTGETEWLCPLSTESTPSLIDIDNDGIDEIIFAEGNYIRCYEYTGGNVDVEDDSDNNTTPKEFELEQNYPNPFNPSTTIEYEIPARNHVLITIYNINGQVVDVLVDEDQSAGKHTVVWDGRNVKSEQLATGIYLYSIKAGSNEVTKKMLLLK